MIARDGRPRARGRVTLKPGPFFSNKIPAKFARVSERSFLRPRRRRRARRTDQGARSDRARRGDFTASDTMPTDADSYGCASSPRGFVARANPRTILPRFINHPSPFRSNAKSSESRATPVGTPLPQRAGDGRTSSRSCTTGSRTTGSCGRPSPCDGARSWRRTSTSTSSACT